MVKAGNKTYLGAKDIPATVPVFPLTGALLLPGGQMPLNIFEPRYLDMIDDAMRGSKIVGMVQPCLKSEVRDSNSPPLSKIGCLGRISAFQESGDGRYLISLCGVSRYRIVEEIRTDTRYRQCEISVFEEDLCGNNDCDREIDRDALLIAFENFLSANRMQADWETINETDTCTLVTAMCMMCPFGPAEKQALLEADNLKQRTETLIAISEFHLAQQSGNDGISIQ